jgi:hypothetical protein
MKKGNYGELFTDDNDPAWDTAPAEAGKRRRERIVGAFYQCSLPWFDKAAEVSGTYLALAVRLYRRWRMRKPGADAVVVSAAALAGAGHSTRGRQVVVDRLEEAGLIEVVERGQRGRAPRVRVIDPQLQQ